MTARKGQCVVHYDSLTLDTPNLTLLTSDTHQRLLQSKNARVKLGGSHFHEKQIKSLPTVFILGDQYIHRQCYQKFTKAISVQVQKSLEAAKVKKGQVSPLKRRKRSDEKSGTLYPNVCMKCKSGKPVTSKGKKQYPRVLQTFLACQTVKRAAELSNDTDMQLLISGQDLIAKEFKMHPNCYRDFTRICSKQSSGAAASNTSTSSYDDNEATDDTPDTLKGFESVCSFISNNVIRGNQSVSLKILTDMYGFNKEDSRLRFKVKQRIQTEFGEEVAFVSISYQETQVLVSRSTFSSTTLGNFMKGNKEFLLKEAATILRKDILEMIDESTDLPWPPTPESLSWENRQPPESIKRFLRTVLHETHHEIGNETQRYIDSISQDLVHAISKGIGLPHRKACSPCHWLAQYHWSESTHQDSRPLGTLLQL